MLDRMISQPILELQNVNKSFGHVQANKNISLKVNKGDIHGIIGENGAGKSTLMSIVYGLYQADSGNIKINDKLISYTRHKQTDFSICYILIYSFTHKFSVKHHYNTISQG